MRATYPFPGMDPYLEHPDLWPDVHNSLIADLRRALAPAVRPKYVVRLEERTYLSEPDEIVLVGRADVSVRTDAPPEGDPSDADSAPDRAPEAVAVEVPVPDYVRETYLEVRSVESGDVVTVLELLSPSNKTPGRGRRRYAAKRMAIPSTRTHLVEIDLVRAGEPMPVQGTTETSDYRLLVSRGDRRPRAELYPISVRDPIPTFRLPLLPGDEEPVVDVGATLRELYDSVSYDASIDYTGEPVPPLSEAHREWVDALLREADRR